MLEHVKLCPCSTPSCIPCPDNPGVRSRSLSLLRPEDTWKDLTALGYDDMLAFRPAGDVAASGGDGGAAASGASGAPLVEDEAAKKRRKKKEKAARQKAAKTQAAGGGGNAAASSTANVQEGGLDQVMIKLYDDRCTASEKQASAGNLAEAQLAALDALKITEEFPRAHTCIGDVLKAMGQVDAAARSYKRAEELVALIAATAKEEAGIP